MASTALRRCCHPGFLYRISKQSPRYSPHQAILMSIRSKQTQAETDTVDMEKPVQYSTSKAHQWQAHESFVHKPRDVPWYQPSLVVLSVSAFLLYFCVLREENDLDRSLEVSIFDRIPGLEEKTRKGHENYLKQMELRQERLSTGK